MGLQIFLPEYCIEKSLGIFLIFLEQHALSVNVMILMKLKNNKIKILQIKSICDWFVDNKISIHFGDGKTKPILFATEFKIKNVRKLNIKYGDTQIKQHSKVKYLGFRMHAR